MLHHLGEGSKIYVQLNSELSEAIAQNVNAQYGGVVVITDSRVRANENTDALYALSGGVINVKRSIVDGKITEMEGNVNIV